jgi:hypothetical protein
MMNKQQKIELTQRKELQSDGWHVSQAQSIKSNDGFVTESMQHLVAKLSAAMCLSEIGYRINTEVSHENGHAEIDLLAYGLSDRQTYAVEIETDPGKARMKEKRYKYLTEHIDDMIVIDLNDMPENMIAAQSFIEGALNVKYLGE